MGCTTSIKVSVSQDINLSKSGKQIQDKGLNDLKPTEKSRAIPPALLTDAFSLADTISVASLDNSSIASLMNSKAINDIHLTPTPQRRHESRQSNFVDSTYVIDPLLISQLSSPGMIPNNTDDSTPISRVGSRSISRIWTENDEETLRDTSKSQILVERIQAYSVQFQAAKNSKADFTLCGTCNLLEYYLPPAAPRINKKSSLSPAVCSNPPIEPSPVPSPSNSPGSIGKPPLAPKKEKEKETQMSNSVLFLFEPNQTGARRCCICGSGKIGSNSGSKPKDLPEISLHELEFGLELSNR